MAASAADKQAVEALLLRTLHSQGSIEDSDAFLREHALNEELVLGVLRSLESDSMVLVTTHDVPVRRLTAEGKDVVSQGSPEVRLFHAIPVEGGDQKTLEAVVGKDAFKFGLASAMKLRWLRVDKETKTIHRNVDSVRDETHEQLAALEDLSAKDFAQLKKRKLVVESVRKTFTVARGKEFALERKKKATALTAEMLKSGAWRAMEFKGINLHAKGHTLASGALHPLLKVRAQFRSILLEMGFEEMPTNYFVESSFWNFDSLFQPQQHPARDAHDTFFLLRPKECLSIPEAYCQRVRAVHEHGGYGSTGYKYDWSIDEAKKTILRTHTTAISSRMLYALAQGPFQPKKYFSIDRVFRNEAIDTTHLAEFHQVEGLVADRNLTLGHLIGTIQEFFSRIGIHQLRFKPAYNPYTEPSMEIFGYSEQLHKWIEVGNSGIFRPEMLQPMGLPEDVRVIAWGLSLERPTMIKYGLRDIRDLFGYRMKVSLIQSNPIARFD